MGSASKGATAPLESIRYDFICDFIILHLYTSWKKSFGWDAFAITVWQHGVSQPCHLTGRDRDGRDSPKGRGGAKAARLAALESIKRRKIWTVKLNYLNKDNIIYCKYISMFQNMLQSVACCRGSLLWLQCEEARPKR